MKKRIFLALIIFLAGMIWSPLHRTKVEATVSASCGGKDCPSFENWCGGNFPFPLPPDFPWPTLKPCPKPTNPPSPTPTLPPEVTPTPTLPPGEPTPTTPPPTEGGAPPAGAPPSGDGGGGATPYSCGAAVPQGAPTLTSVSPAGSGQMNVSWTAVSGVTHYALSYGPTSGNYLYGVANTGNTTTFTVGELDPGKNYCFAVRGVNDCAPGPLSNERCSGAVLGAATGGQVLGLSTTGGSSLWESLFYIMGFLWLGVGSKFYLLSKRASKRA